VKQERRVKGDAAIFTAERRKLQPNSKRRVLLVDDAVVVRKALSDAIALDPDLEVAATAVNGRVALAKFGTVKPDIVLLDIEMPGMDGLETVRELRKIDSGVPIIMFSTLTKRGASVTLEALALGATDYVAKPGNVNGAASFETVTAELIPKIRALCHLPALRGNSLPESKAFPSPRLPPAARILPPVHIAVIGVSTGGPDALAQLLPSLPREASHSDPHCSAHASRLHFDAGKQTFIEIEIDRPGMRFRGGDFAGLRSDCSR
jgi:chemotaxis response regulator CheB